MAARGGWKLDSRVGPCDEVLGWSGVLHQANHNNFLMDHRRGASAIYACAELLWYLSGTDKIKMLQAYAPSYVNFSDDGETANGAYGDRIRSPRSSMECDQLIGVIETLKRHPSSRQAVIAIWRPEDLVDARDLTSKDLPCTLSLQFFERHNRLYGIGTMRSNDVWLGMPYDIWCFTMLQHIIARTLGLACGSYKHQVGSLHFYHKDVQKFFSKEDKLQPIKYLHHEWHDWVGDLNENIRTAVQLEEAIRTGEHSSEYEVQVEVFNRLGRGTIWADLVLACASKWCKVDLAHIQSQALRGGLRHHDHSRRYGFTGKDDSGKEASGGTPF